MRVAPLKMGVWYSDTGDMLVESCTRVSKYVRDALMPAGVCDKINSRV